MTSKRATSRAGAAVAGALIFSGLAVAPALAYPPGTAMTLTCTPSAVVQTSVTCTASNTNPAFPTVISFAEAPSAAGLEISKAAFALPSADVTQTLTCPAKPGIYVVTAVNGDQQATQETAVTNVNCAPVQGGGGGTSGGGATTPSTGAGNVALGVIAGLGALGLGGGLIMASRRKQV